MTSALQTRVDLPVRVRTQTGLIQALIPLGLEAVSATLAQEVEQLAGPR